jgi:putative acetyltransferase
MDSTVFIREIKKEDNPHLAQLIRDVFDEHGAPHHGTVYSDLATDDLNALFSKSRSVLFVAEIDNRIYGCCGIYPTDGLDNDTAELVKFYLNPAYRSKGIGRALMEKCIEEAKSLGYKRLYIESMPQFAKAVKMYEKQGFRRISYPLGNSGHISCDIWMVKDL